MSVKLLLKLRCFRSVKLQPTLLISYACWQPGSITWGLTQGLGDRDKHPPHLPTYLFTVRVTQVAQGGCAVSILGDTQKISRHSPGLSVALLEQGAGPDGFQFSSSLNHPVIDLLVTDFHPTPSKRIIWKASFETAYPSKEPQTCIWSYRKKSIHLSHSFQWYGSPGIQLWILSWNIIFLVYLYFQH